MKPPVLYYGAKGSVASRIVAMMPEHEGYIEPFAGSLAVLLAKPRARMEVMNDLDGRLMTFWRILRDRPLELARAAMLTPHSRAELELATGFDGADDLEIARRVWVALTQGRSPIVGRKTGWRYFSDPVATSSAMSKYMDAYRERIEPAAERIAAVSLECRPALDVIQRYGKVSTNLIYVDPPYLAETRHGAIYAHEMPEPEKHRELAEALNSSTASVMISGYAHPLYDEELYAGWHRAEMSAWTANSQGFRGRTEVLWSNVPFAKEMVDAA